MTRKRNTLNSFGPHLLAALIKGSREEVVLKPILWRQAVVLRQRINQLRKLMLEENHPLAMAVQRASVSVHWGPKFGLPEIKTKTNANKQTYPIDGDAEVMLRILPKDDEFAEIFERAGITPTEGTQPELPLEPTAPTPLSPSVAADLESILAEIDIKD